MLWFPQDSIQGANSITYRGSHLWNSIPDVAKSCDCALSFKRQIREWSGSTCPAELVDGLVLYVKSRMYCNWLFLESM